MFDKLTKKLFAFSASHYRLFPVLAAVLIWGILGLPDPAHADILDDITGGAAKLFFSAVIIILMIIATTMLLQRHIMGLFVMMAAGVLVLLVGNTELVVKLAEAVANLFKLGWKGTPTGGGQ